MAWATGRPATFVVSRPEPNYRAGKRMIHKRMTANQFKR
jgi:hypothetical protein